MNEALTIDEAQIAFRRWKEFHGPEHDRNTYDECIKYLEIYDGSAYSAMNGTYTVPANVARKVRLLNSPHWRTILEAYKIKQREPSEG